MAWLKLKLPFKVSGKLSTTPEQAKRIFNFTMKPGATGIVLVRHKNGIYIRDCIPHRPFPTKEQKLKEKKLKIIGQIGSKYLQELVRPVWNPIADKKRCHSGHSLFIGTNMKAVAMPPKWENLTLTEGKLPPPQLLPPIRQKKKITLQITNAKPGDKISIAVLDTVKFTFWHQKPQKCNPGKIVVTLPAGMYNVIVYAYFKHNNQYSPSTSIRCKDSTYTKF